MCKSQTDLARGTEAFQDLQLATFSSAVAEVSAAENEGLSCLGDHC
jgi:hypothetical protein